MKELTMDYLVIGKGKPVLIETDSKGNISSVKRLQIYAEKLKKYQKGGDK